MAKSLAEKLGLKPGLRSFVLNPPPGYPELLGRLPKGAAPKRRAEGGLDFIHAFATTRAGLEASFPRLASTLAEGGIFWVSWPKKASDLDRAAVLGIARAQSLAATGACDVGDAWSSLRLQGLTVRRRLSRRTRESLKKTRAPSP